MMNPTDMMKLSGEFARFRENHPKLLRFLRVQAEAGIPEGSVLELNIRRPGKEAVAANIKVQPEDVAFFETLGRL